MKENKQVRVPTKTRVADKYHAMITYYAELIGLCHETVSKTESLKMLDPMGRKTTATSLFIRVCGRMDKSIEAKDKAEKLVEISKATEIKKAV